MCGICGEISRNQEIVKKESIKRMMREIKHRGPNSEGQYISEKIGLGFVRLSILDLTKNGDQPMLSEDGNFVIIFNGEIYNYLEIKESIKQEFNFRTRTDTEVVLNAYIKWGKDCLTKLNGMFAFAIFDKKNNKVFAARDRFGVKPFYYFVNRDKFLFCSEIKGILSTGILKAEINEKMLYDFIVFNRTDHTRFTCFKHIKNLKPGHYIEMNLVENKFKVKKWYFLPNITKSTRPLCYYKERLLKKLKNSIELSLISDVPVGMALSGGIDSSTIVSLVNEDSKFEKKVKTFSAVYDASWEKDETKYIEEVVKEKGLESHLVYPNPKNLVKMIDKLIYQQEEPFASASIFASWSVYQLADYNGTRVLLSGQGADEVFGYDYMAAFYFYELFLKLKWRILFKEIILFVKKQASTKFTLQLFIFLLLPRFFRNRLLFIPDKIINKNFYRKFKNTSDFNKRFFSSKSLNESVKNHLLMKLNHLLRVEDKNSMYFSVESRVPFLEHKLVEFALNIPSCYKVYNGEVKYVLKQSVKDYIPELIFKRNNKIGYETPMDSWFRTDILKKEFEKILYNKHQPLAKYLDIDLIKKKWEEHINEGKNHEAALWKYFYLNKWHKLYFEL